MDELRVLATAAKPLFLCVTETWFTPDTVKWGSFATANKIGRLMRYLFRKGNNAALLTIQNDTNANSFKICLRFIVKNLDSDVIVS